ncbi:membrane protein [Paenibacillus montaniterrae]|uniref:Membrane protein n=1 Tax=Paenibacillus montaniterrae TaxID=429341 RepID=A0A920CUP3_9BACL|nr:SPFH domain-containing protein [Paenibacillus montaniterrae]GIP17242.1 membrane protein [Paenibacillus montaniterrae]
MKTKQAWHLNGFVAILLALVLAGLGAFAFFQSADNNNLVLIFSGILLVAIAGIICTSLTIVQPNEAKVITFFGRYIGSLSKDGLWMVVPLTVKMHVTLRVNNFNSQTLKVNDAEGNPIEIGAVVVYKVIDSAKASFDVDDYESFVEIQSETAVRHIAAQYPYDSFSAEHTLTLRGNADEVAEKLQTELQERLSVAGVAVLETRLTHLAYAPEIASAMLQRQQASAIVSARKQIVDGAVGMVEAALKQLEEKGIELDSERRAAMVNNLMVTIVSDRSTTPVINTGTLYS